MTEKLNPSEAQRERMIQAAIDHSGMGSIRATQVVDAQIAAANSLPEGAPVGTIARRPDGKWIGVRDDRRHNVRGRAIRWLYTPLHESATDWPELDDADSWPVIYDPTEPSVDEVEELAKWLSIHLGQRSEIEWELRTKPNYYHDRAQELLDLGYRRRTDPTAQQEPAPWVCDHPNHGNNDHDCNPFRPPGSPRIPRVRDRLGVDEQDAEWTRTEVSRDTYTWEYRFRSGVWQVRLIGHKVWASMLVGTAPVSGPFTEVIE